MVSAKYSKGPMFKTKLKRYEIRQKFMKLYLIIEIFYYLKSFSIKEPSSTV